MMEKRIEVKRRLGEFLSNASFHPCPRMLGTNVVRRALWTILGLVCNGLLFAAVSYLLDDYEKSPTKMSSSIGKLCKRWQHYKGF